MEMQIGQPQECTKSPVKASEFECGVNATAKSLCVLHETIERLSDRLRPVLNPEQPSGTGEDKQESPTSQIGCFFKDTTSQIHTATSRLAYILERCAL